MYTKLIWLFYLVLVLSMAGNVSADLVGYWKFDEGSGNQAYDSSGYGNDGTIYGIPNWVDGWVSTALDFDGNTNYVEIPHNESLSMTDQITVAAWTNMRTGSSGNKLIVSKGGFGNISYELSEENGSVILLLATSIEGCDPDSPPADEWHHIAATFDGTIYKCYIDGELSGEKDLGYAGTIRENELPVNIGRRSTGGRFFDGMIDEVMIYNHALSGDEIHKVVTDLGGFRHALKPDPADGAFISNSWTALSWQPGYFAVSHDVYMGDNYDDVANGTGETFRGNLDLNTTFFIAGIPGYAFPDGLVPGTTYYWRIDEVNNADLNSLWKGDVWSFTVPSKTADNPDPADGAEFVDLDAVLSWMPGYYAELHTVYIGNDFDDVNDATGGVSGEFTTYTPGELELGKVYYWRVDELDGTNTYKGDVWSFKTIPVIAINDPNLMGWWKFDEGQSQNALDWSGHGKHATLMGGPTWIAGYDGGGLKLDGYNDYVVLPIGWVINSLSSATFTTWVNFSNAGDRWQRIFDFGSGMETYISLCPKTGIDGPMRLAMTTSGAWGESHLDAPTPLASGWYHVSVVVTSTDMKLYLDGVVVASGSTSVALSDLGRTENNWLGRSQYLVDGYFNGSLDDFRIYDYALSTDEIVMTMRGDPMLAWGANPADGTSPDIQVALPLSWSAGEKASQHDVYFGTDADDVDNANKDTPDIYRGRQDGTSYTPPEGVEWGGGPYFWRIDELNTDETMSRGKIWSFSVADFILVDDFEDYDIGNNEIWWSWKDGLGYVAHDNEPAYPGNGTGSAVGDGTTLSYCEETIVHGGGKSMPYFYDNNKQGYSYYSQAELTLDYPRDWTEQNVNELIIWFRGVVSNDAERLYVSLSNRTGAPVVIYHDDPAATQAGAWTEWVIPLQDFADQDIDLTDVNAIAIGVGTKGNITSPGGVGEMFFDDIRLYRLR
jgi:hypothetical protein